MQDAQFATLTTIVFSVPPPGRRPTGAIPGAQLEASLPSEIAAALLAALVRVGGGRSGRIRVWSDGQEVALREDAGTPLDDHGVVPAGDLELSADGAQVVQQRAELARLSAAVEAASARLATANRLAAAAEREAYQVQTDAWQRARAARAQADRAVEEARAFDEQAGAMRLQSLQHLAASAAHVNTYRQEIDQLLERAEPGPSVLSQIGGAVVAFGQTSLGQALAQQLQCSLAAAASTVAGQPCSRQDVLLGQVVNGARAGIVRDQVQQLAVTFPASVAARAAAVTAGILLDPQAPLDALIELVQQETSGDD